MITVLIDYNPSIEITKIKINDKELNRKSVLNKYLNKKLQLWTCKFMEDLKYQLNTSVFNIEFIGTKEDFKYVLNLVSEFLKQNVDGKIKLNHIKITKNKDDIKKIIKLIKLIKKSPIKEIRQSQYVNKLNKSNTSLKEAITLINLIVNNEVYENINNDIEKNKTIVKEIEKDMCNIKDRIINDNLVSLNKTTLAIKQTIDECMCSIINEYDEVFNKIEYNANMYLSDINVFYDRAELKDILCYIGSVDRYAKNTLNELVNEKLIFQYKSYLKDVIKDPNILDYILSKRKINLYAENMKLWEINIDYFINKSKYEKSCFKKEKVSFIKRITNEIFGEDLGEEINDYYVVKLDKVLEEILSDILKQIKTNINLLKDSLYMCIDGVQQDLQSETKKISNQMLRQNETNKKMETIKNDTNKYIELLITNLKWIENIKGELEKITV